MINTEKLIELAKYFTVIHHIKGRIRVRVSSKIRELEGSISLSDIEELPSKIEGINTIKINKLVGSVTIEYDHEVFRKELWDNLIEGHNLEEVTQLINKLYKEVL